MYIYSWYRSMMIDLSKFDELRIERFDKNGKLCEYSDAVSYELRAVKHVAKGSEPAWTCLFGSESYDECEELLNGILRHIIKEDTAVLLADDGEGTPAVREYKIR